MEELDLPESLRRTDLPSVSGEEWFCEEEATEAIVSMILSIWWDLSTAPTNNWESKMNEWCDEGYDLISWVLWFKSDVIHIIKLKTIWIKWRCDDF